LKSKFADKLKDMVCVLSCTEKKLEDKFKNTPLGEHWRNGITAESEVFVNNLQEETS
jgi:hypothetical protein